ncbi:MAG: glyoxalase superfamily protein [Pseudomonadota bacterium]
MDDHTSPAAGPAVPTFRSFNEEATRAFYMDFLGFEVLFEHRFEPDFPLYMGIRLGDCEIHLSEHYGDVMPGGGARIPVPDVHALAEALNVKKYKFSRPGVTDQPWGEYSMDIKDPNGNRVTFFTPKTA